MSQQENERDETMAAPAIAQQWYTTTEAAKRIGVSAAKFRVMVNDQDALGNELRSSSIPNYADKRSRLYPVDLINRIAALARPQAHYTKRAGE